MIVFVIVSAACLIYFIMVQVLTKLMGNQLHMKERLKRLMDATSEHVPEVDEQRQNKRNRKGDKRAGASKIQQQLDGAGVLIRASEYVIIWAVVTFLPAFILFLVNPQPVAVIGLAIIGFSIPPILVNRAKNKRMVLFEKQLGDALMIICNCLRAGFSFQQSMESIAREMPDPIAKEFGRALREMQLGISIEQSLQRMVIRNGNKDVDLLVSAVLIQRQIGAIWRDLDGIADTIKDRLRIKGEVRVLTTTGRISGMVVGLLPVFIMLAFSVINPGYMNRFFTNPIGTAMLVVAVVLEFIGFIIVRKMVDIKF